MCIQKDSLKDNGDSEQTDVKGSKRIQMENRDKINLGSLLADGI